MQTNFLLNIPAMKVPGAERAKTLRCGEGSLVTTIPDTTKADYDVYLELLEQYGFVKYVDNGDGIDHSVYCATYTRDNIVLTIGYYSGHKKTSICLAFDMPLSKNLFYDESYVKDNKQDAKTKLHMKELWLFGNSFIFQLKNNHFIISDGGTWRDTPYLLDYLESLVPEGEIPVVDAWVITHGHMDHIGCLNEIWEHKEWLERIRVEQF